jgi:hypothetical protein
MTRRSFENWITDDLEVEFGLKETKAHPILAEWIAVAPNYSENEAAGLLDLREFLREHILFWKEQELIMHFIGPLLTMVRINGSTFNGFAARKISAKIGDWELSGLVDYMVATGKQNPRQPFFCFHEYKAERRRDSDPLGQVLAAMLVAQTNNNWDKPLFGAFVNGRNWQFVILSGKEYSVSLAFDSTQDDLFQIFSILRDLKRRIEAMIL